MTRARRASLSNLTREARALIAITPSAARVLYFERYQLQSDLETAAQKTAQSSSSEPGPGLEIVSLAARPSKFKKKAGWGVIVTEAAGSQTSRSGWACIAGSNQVRGKLSATKASRKLGQDLHKAATLRSRPWKRGTCS